MLKLPASRLRQLKALATARNSTMSDLIGALINDAIAKGEIPDETPGLIFARHGTGLSIKLDEEAFRMDFYRAEEFYVALRRVSESGGTWRATNMQRGLELYRVGIGTILELKENTRSIARSSITKTIVSDLRRQIRTIFSDNSYFASNEETD